MGDLSEQIETNAAGPRKASGDAGSFESHSLPDQIAADQYLRKVESANKRKLSIRVAKTIPGGAV